MKYTIKVLLILSMSQLLLPVGAGIFLYRQNQGDIEFLVTFDPGHARGATYGFEYPGGGIDEGPHEQALDLAHCHTHPDDPNTNPDDEQNDFTGCNNPYNFLRGAIRETLEELVFVPATLLEQHGEFQPTHANTPYRNRTINPTYEQEAINAIQQQIFQDGVMLLLKKAARPLAKGLQAADVPYNQMAVFLWNVTDLLEHLPAQTTLPQAIVNQRARLGNAVANLHAEPVAFAWIKGNDILRALRADNPVIPAFEYAADAHAGVPQQVYNRQQNTVTLSRACMEMMADRSDAIHGANQQDFHFVVGNNLNTDNPSWTIIDPRNQQLQLRRRIEHQQPAQVSSDMGLFIRLYQYELQGIAAKDIQRIWRGRAARRQATQLRQAHQQNQQKLLQALQLAELVNDHVLLEAHHAWFMHDSPQLTPQSA